MGEAIYVFKFDGLPERRAWTGHLKINEWSSPGLNCMAGSDPSKMILHRDLEDLLKLVPEDDLGRPAALLKHFRIQLQTRQMIKDAVSHAAAEPRSPMLDDTPPVEGRAEGVASLQTYKGYPAIRVDGADGYALAPMTADELDELAALMQVAAARLRRNRRGHG